MIYVGYVCAVISYRLSRQSPVDFALSVAALSLVVSFCILLLFNMWSLCVSWMNPAVKMATTVEIVRLFASISLCTVVPVAGILSLDEPKTSPVKVHQHLS